MTGDALLIERTVADYVDDLASAKPAPGGGSAAALAGALGAALVSMVANLTIGRERYRAAEAAMQRVLATTDRLRRELLVLVDLDAAAYDRVAAAYRLPRTTDDDQQARSAAIQAALKAATEVPLRIARACAEVGGLCPEVASLGNPNAISDAGAAALLADAAFQAALLNVEINLRGIRDADYVERVRQATARDRGEIGTAREQTLTAVRRALGG